jgi:metal-sulfur cluster biosynthetic enzyme
MMEPMDITPESVRSCLRSIIDPEMGINIVDLGLVYDVHVGDNRIDVDMTLTNPGCPLAGMIATEVEQAIRTAFEEIDDVEVSLVWDPPWTFERLSESAKERLGYEG